MDESIRRRILELNKQFYQTFAREFSATRRRIQPGVRRILAQIPHEGNWLDLGCGNGNLAAEWIRQKRVGIYLGMDFSAALLEEARASLVQTAVPDSLTIRFELAEIATQDWRKLIGRKTWDGVMAFAALHHIPGKEVRMILLKKIYKLLKMGGRLVFSVWQFQHSDKLLKRIQPWEKAGFKDADIEEGDTLLDWRFSLTGEPGSTALRYVHLFTADELQDLANNAGFKIFDQFESDGEGGRLGLYQIWEKS